MLQPWKIFHRTRGLPLWTKLNKRLTSSFSLIFASFTPSTVLSALFSLLSLWSGWCIHVDWISGVSALKTWHHFDKQVIKDEWNVPGLYQELIDRPRFTAQNSRVSYYGLCVWMWETGSGLTKGHFAVLIKSKSIIQLTSVTV